MREPTNRLVKRGVGWKATLELAKNVHAVSLIKALHELADGIEATLAAQERSTH